MQEMLKDTIRAELNKQPEQLITKTAAKKALGIVDDRTFDALGIKPVLRGKRMYYTLKSIMKQQT